MYWITRSYFHLIGDILEGRNCRNDSSFHNTCMYNCRCQSNKKPIWYIFLTKRWVRSPWCIITCWGKDINLKIIYIKKQQQKPIRFNLVFQHPSSWSKDECQFFAAMVRTRYLRHMLISSRWEMLHRDLMEIN